MIVKTDGPFAALLVAHAHQSAAGGKCWDGEGEVTCGVLSAIQFGARENWKRVIKV